MFNCFSGSNDCNGSNLRETIRNIDTDKDGTVLLDWEYYGRYMTIGNINGATVLLEPM